MMVDMIIKVGAEGIQRSKTIQSWSAKDDTIIKVGTC